MRNKDDEALICLVQSFHSLRQRLHSLADWLGHFGWGLQ